MGWSLSSNLEFVAKFIAKSLALSNEDKITSGPFIIKGTESLSLLILIILQSLQDSSFLLSTLVWAAFASIYYGHIHNIALIINNLNQPIITSTTNTTIKY